MKIHSFEMDYKEVWVLEQNTEQRERRHKGYVKSAQIESLFGIPLRCHLESFVKKHSI